MYTKLHEANKECNECLAGSYTSGGGETTRHHCSDCEAGHECHGDSEVHECTPGYFSKAKASECTACPAGHYTGKYKTETCEECGADNMYTKLHEANKECTECLAGSYTSGGGETTRHHCSDCEAGHECH